MKLHANSHGVLRDTSPQFLFQKSSQKLQYDVFFFCKRYSHESSSSEREREAGRRGGKAAGRQVKLDREDEESFGIEWNVCQSIEFINKNVFSFFFFSLSSCLFSSPYTLELSGVSWHVANKQFINIFLPANFFFSILPAFSQTRSIKLWEVKWANWFASSSKVCSSRELCREKSRRMRKIEASERGVLCANYAPLFRSLYVCCQRVFTVVC